MIRINHYLYIWNVRESVCFPFPQNSEPAATRMWVTTGLCINGYWSIPMLVMAKAGCGLRSWWGWDRAIRYARGYLHCHIHTSTRESYWEKIWLEQWEALDMVLSMACHCLRVKVLPRFFSHFNIGIDLGCVCLVKYCRKGEFLSF